jgi:hypothetical protein
MPATFSLEKLCVLSISVLIAGDIDTDLVLAYGATVLPLAFA